MRNIFANTRQADYKNAETLKSGLALVDDSK